MFLINHIKKVCFLELKNVFVEPHYFFFIRCCTDSFSYLYYFFSLPLELYSFYSILELNICLFSLINLCKSVTSPQSMFSGNHMC